MIPSVLLTYARNLDYARRLAADIPADQMAAQPFPGMNHPAWILGHLAFYGDFAAKLMGLEEPTLDPVFGPRVDNQSTPAGDPALYPARDELLAAFERGHGRLAEAVAAAGPDQLARPMPIERIRSRFPTVGDMLLYLMTAHEAIHLGQLSAWRRAMGLPSV